MDKNRKSLRTPLPLDEKLLQPSQLKQFIEDKNSDSQCHGFKIFEVGWQGLDSYHQGHIPGAFYLDTNEIEEKPLWNRKSDKELKRVFEKNGMTCDQTMILYSKNTMAAARAAVILMYAGVKDVRLLDGGYPAWVSEGYKIDNIPHFPEPVNDFGEGMPACPNYFTSIDKLKSCYDNAETVLSDIRSWQEYIGETSGYSYINKRGRIKGAKWGHAGSDAYHLQDYHDKNGKMRHPQQMAGNWKKWGITPDKQVIFYCGTGWRASVAFFCAYLMGWDNISIFDGGWYEWSSDPALPIETGEP
ncbi:thiosulfate/3-mercaptopyruvate sulfurtransferase [Scopulibacillus daqui]|uniref:Thiosulfate/3-mercaptopyruvate sulfurtransferase n=1 Tax=Scopulibacillus daqui TaxID=1469162 RepID=A0ABS2PWJ6_9BACL|nr:rhodanese-like domain-containing protein [Scopulibacillus daqui]MBM7644429.1 thiosulfate/3-mercaptopyruvate sulfurtransferase [Scopulibacillus daqui]